MTPTFSVKSRVAAAVVQPGVHARLHPAYAIERFAAALLLILLSPLLLLLVIAIAVLSRSGPFVRHARVGWRGESLRMLKFRTMWGGEAAVGRFQFIEDVCGPPMGDKRAEDARVTSRFAAVCRRYSLDELPQLWHVLRGEMSLVGPRPITRIELETHYANCMAEVLSMRPGMTGLWQVMGRNDLTYSTRRRLDRILVRRASVSLYLAVLLRSIPCVINGKGAY